MGLFLLMALAMITGNSYGEIEEAKGAFTVPFTSSMHLGYFYNVDGMATCAKSPFTPEGRQSPVTITHESSSFLYKVVSSTKEKRDLLNIKGSLSLKIKALNGIDIAASGEYLKEKVSNSNFVEILAIIKFVKETRTLTRQTAKADDYLSEVKDAVGQKCLHYIRSVEYGGEMIASLRFTSKEDTSIEDIKAEASVDVRASTVEVSLQGKFQKLAKDLAKTSNFEATIYKSGGSGGNLVNSVEALNEYMSQFVSDMTAGTNLKEIRATLMPVQQLVPASEVTTAMRFIIDRALEASSNRFDQYLDDILQAEELTKIIREETTITNEEDEQAAEELYNDVNTIAIEFRKVIQDLTLNELSSVSESNNFDNAIESYNTRLGGGVLPWKYTLGARTLLDKLNGVDVAESVPTQLTSELKALAKLLATSEAWGAYKEKVKCFKNSLRADSVTVPDLLSAKTNELILPGFAMNLYSTADPIPANTPIAFSEVDDGDYIQAYFNIEVEIPSTNSARDYYRNEIMGAKKKKLSKILKGKKSYKKRMQHKKQKKHFYKDESSETKVALFQDTKVVAPLNGVYLLSYQLYNTGDVTEIQAQEPCENGWEEFNGQCYQMSSGSDRYNSARRVCEMREAELVQVKSQEEQDFVYNFCNHQRIWLGLRRVDGVFQWRDGTAVSYENWSSSEPNNSGGHEYYGEMLSTGVWNDIYDRDNKFVCVKGTRKNIESKGLVHVRVKKGEDVLSNHRSRSETPEDVAGSKCDVPSDVLPMSKPIIAALVTGDEVRLEQTVDVTQMEEKDNFYSAVLLSAVSSE